MSSFKVAIYYPIKIQMNFLQKILVVQPKEINVKYENGMQSELYAILIHMHTISSFLQSDNLFEIFESTKKYRIL